MEEKKKVYFTDCSNSYHGKSFLGKTWIRTLGALGSGMGLALLALSTKILTIAEIVFKGFGNMFKGEFTTGLKQLLLALPCAIIDLAIGGPLHAVYTLVVDTLGLALSPFNYSKERAEWHENKVKQLEDSKTTKKVIEHLDTFFGEEVEMTREYSFSQNISSMFDYGQLAKQTSEFASIFNNAINGNFDYKDYSIFFSSPAK